MKKIVSIICCLALIACLYACSDNQDISVSPSDVSATDTPSAQLQVFDEEQMNIISILSDNALALMKGESQMYMMAIAYQSEQYEATQQYAYELCSNYDIEIELEYLSIEVDGSTAQATVRQHTVLTPKDGGASTTYESVLRHDMICRSDVWNILYTYCESTQIIHDIETLKAPILAGAEALSQADTEAYMLTVNPDSAAYDDTQLNAQTICYHYHIAIDVESCELIEQTNTTASVRTVQTTEMLSKKTHDVSIYRDTTVHELVLIDGAWYVDSSTLESSELLSGPAVEDIG